MVGLGAGIYMQASSRKFPWLSGLPYLLYLVVPFICESPTALASPSIVHSIHRSARDLLIYYANLDSGPSIQFTP